MAPLVLNMILSCCAVGKTEDVAEEEVLSSVESESDQAEDEEYQEDFEDAEEQQAAASAANKGQNAVSRKV